MLPRQIRFKLHFGPYQTPRFKIGAVVTDELRGDVKIVGVSDARIPWPVAFHWRARSVVVYGALARAVRRESVQAVAHWWGISVEKVRLIRRALNVSDFNEGTMRLHRRYAQTPEFRRKAEKAWANAGSPERRAINSKAQQGRVHSKATCRKIAAANRRRVTTDDSRRRRSEAAKRCGAWPPAAGRPWTADEIAVLKTFPRLDAATRTGRSIQSVDAKRRQLGLSSRGALAETNSSIK